jgi:Transposase DDE domain
MPPASRVVTSAGTSCGGSAGASRFRRIRRSRWSATWRLIGFHVCRGPCVDSPQFTPTLLQASAHHAITELLGDKGYDAEHNHRLCREELGIKSTIIAVRRNTNGTRQWPSTRYRREMKKSSLRPRYGQRWQIESSISRHKRLLGAALRARTWIMQQWECMLRALTHNLMLLAAT